MPEVSDAAPARPCAAHLYMLSKSCVSKCAWEPTYVRGGYRIAVKLRKGGGGCEVTVGPAGVEEGGKHVCVCVCVIFAC